MPAHANGLAITTGREINTASSAHYGTEMQMGLPMPQGTGLSANDAEGKDKRPMLIGDADRLRAES